MLTRYSDEEVSLMVQKSCMIGVTVARKMSCARRPLGASELAATLEAEGAPAGRAREGGPRGCGAHARSCAPRSLPTTKNKPPRPSSAMAPAR